MKTALWVINLALLPFTGWLFWVLAQRPYALLADPESRTDRFTEMGQFGSVLMAVLIWAALHMVASLITAALVNRKGR